MRELDQIHPPAVLREELDRFPQPMPTPTLPVRQYGVLVVDDDELIRRVLKIGLQNYGFDVHVAASGLEALQQYQQQPTAIHLALLDIRMPGMDGPQTLAALRQLNSQLRCCFMSADTDSYTQEQLRDLGMAAFFGKPFHLTAVAQTLWELAASTAEALPNGKVHHQTALA